MAQLIIFTDLDGTLLDHDTYSYSEAKEALDKINEKHIPLVICTSKTRAEIEVYGKKLDNIHPFISENGGAIFIPDGYFDFDFKSDYDKDGYCVIKLGAKYEDLKEVVLKIKNEGIRINNFRDWSAQEISKDSGLSLEEAELSKKREFDEVFTINEADESLVKKIIHKNGLRMTKGGRYYHLMGNSDKGKAVTILTELYKKKYGEVKTVGIGDSKNDFEMLDAVDKHYLVQKKDGSYSSKDYDKAKGIGPIGWNIAILKVIDVA